MFDLQRTDEKNASICEMCAEECEYQDVFAIDDLSGAQLPFQLVAEARKEEMNHMMGHTLHVVDKAECMAKTSKQPLSTRWIDTDKSQGQGVMKVRGSRFQETGGERP